MVGTLTRLPQGTRLGDGWSGLLAQQPLTNRIALATEAAWRRVHTPEVSKALLKELERSGRFSLDLLQAHGFLTTVYPNGKGVEKYGLMTAPVEEMTAFFQANRAAENYMLWMEKHCPTVVAELEAHQGAEKQLLSVERGPHRRLWLALQDVGTEHMLEVVPDNVYCAMLAKIREVHNDPGFTRISSVKISRKNMLDSIAEQPDGQLEIIFSLAELAKYPNWAHPTLTISNRL